jgi:hypothetical protein
MIRQTRSEFLIEHAPHGTFRTSQETDGNVRVVATACDCGNVMVESFVRPDPNSGA